MTNFLPTSQFECIGCMMLPMTIKEMLQKQPGIQVIRYRLYLIRDGEVVFYVGQSTNPYNRFLSHMSLDGRNGPSHTGTFLIENAPASGTWMFEQYTVEECNPFVEQFRATFSAEMQALYKDVSSCDDVDEAEEALIKFYRPCLNTADNPNPTPLPAHTTKATPSVRDISMLSSWSGCLEWNNKRSE